jgi:DNA-binding CsgD family transcriptional regulator
MGKVERSISPRQREVVHLVAAGLTNDEIASTLGISPRTAKAYTDELRRRLGVPRRRQIPLAYLRLTGEVPLR